MPRTKMEGTVMRHIAIAATVLVLALSVGPMMAHVIPPDEKPLDTDDGTPLAAPADDDGDGGIGTSNIYTNSV